MRAVIALWVLMLTVIAPPALQASEQKDPTLLPKDYVLLTVFLKHDQSKALTEIGKELKETKFWAKFPSEGVEVVGWYVMMGIGQVVILRVPPERVRQLNRAIELTAWRSFRTEFYLTYDLHEFAKKKRAKAQLGK
jgi:hypothetical protein